MNTSEARKRILMIAPTPFFADRGCHVRILGEAKALIALGNRVVVCTYGLGRDIEGIPTERALAIPWYTKLSAGPSVHKFYIDLFLLWKVLGTCRRFRPDLIHAHLHEGIVIGQIASVLYRVPMVADLQGSLTAELLDHRFIPSVPWVVKGMRWIEKQINHMPAHVIVSSTHTAKMCVDVYGISPDRVTPIRDGVDLEIFSRRMRDPELLASLGLSPSDTGR